MSSGPCSAIYTNKARYSPISLPLEIVSFNAHAFGDFVATLKTVRLTGMWRALEEKGLPIEVIRRNSLIAPAACNLASPDRTATVDDAFRVRREVSRSMRGRGGGAG